MEEFISNLIVTLTGVIVAKLLDVTYERLKNKVSKRTGKHAKKP